MFIDHRQEQWPEWLGTAEFAYNNKAHSSTRTLPFKANYGQDSRMGFEGRKKGKYAGAEKFIEKMKEIQKEAKAAVTNFIQPYLHQFFDYSHGLNGYGKPLKRPYYRYQSHLEAISIGRDIRQINW